MKESLEDHREGLIEAFCLLEKQIDVYREAIEEILEVFDWPGVTNICWVKQRLQEALDQEVKL